MSKWKHPFYVSEDSSYQSTNNSLLYFSQSISLFSLFLLHWRINLMHTQSHTHVPSSITAWELQSISLDTKLLGAFRCNPNLKSLQILSPNRPIFPMCVLRCYVGWKLHQSRTPFSHFLLKIKFVDWYGNDEAA